MELSKRLLQKNSVDEIVQIAMHCCSSKKRFKELVDCFLSKDKQVQQYASWVLVWAAGMEPRMMELYVDDVVAQLKRKDVHNAVTRHSLRILMDVTIPETLDGEVMVACFRFIEDPKEKVAVKAFALNVLNKLSNKYPEIIPEIKLLIEGQWQHQTAAFKSSASKILKGAKQ